MQQERKRILRMLADGQITIDECEELLRSLGEQEAQRVELEKRKATQGKRPVWPLVLLGVLVIWTVLSNTVLPILCLVLTPFWVWMIIDCLTRRPSDFRLLFTSEFRYEKWIWLGVVILGHAVGAIVYFVVVRGPARSIAPPTATEAEPAAPQGFTPRRRARTLLPWVLLLVVVAAAPGLILLGLKLHASMGPGIQRVGPRVGAPLAIVFLPVFMLGGLLFLFWIWMLVDCVSRDYREFGTLITRDRSADKLLWLLLIIFLPVIGAIAYHVGVRRRPVEARGGARG